MLNQDINPEKRVLAHDNARSIDHAELDNVSGGVRCTTKLTWTQSGGNDAEVSCTWEF